MHLVRLDTVQTTIVEWLWPNYIPLGELTLMDGEAGVGKSTVCIAIAAIVSNPRGLMPGEKKRWRKGCIVLHLGFEDSLDKTITPRFEAANATLDNVFHMNTVPVLDENGDPLLNRRGDEIRSHFRIPRDLDYLENILDQIKAAKGEEVTLIVCDGIFDILDGKTDSHKQQDVRDNLRNLIQIAQQRNIAIIGIRHFSKAKGNTAKNAGGGSVAFSAIARSVITVGLDEEGNAHMAVAKANLASSNPKDIPSWGFRIISQQGQDHGHVEWTEASGITADEITGGRDTDKPLDKAQRIAVMLKEMFWTQDIILGTVLNAAVVDIDKGGSDSTRDRAKALAGLEVHEFAGKATTWRWTGRPIDPSIPS